MAIVAGKILVGRVDVEEGMALGTEFFQVGTGALGEDCVAGVAVAGSDGALAVGGFMQSIVTTEAPRPIFVVDVVRVGAPISLHFREKVPGVDRFGFLDKGRELRSRRIFGAESLFDSLQRLVLGRVRLDQCCDDV